MTSDSDPVTRSHRRQPRARGWKRTLSTIGVPLSGFALVTAAAVAVTLQGPSAATVTASAAQIPDNPEASVVVSRDYVRSDDELGRDTRIERPAAEEAETMVVIEDATLRTAPSGDARPSGSLDVGEEVVVTGEVVKGYSQVIHGDQELWVAEGRLADELPEELQPLGTEPCPRAPGVENGLQPDAVRALRAVCDRFPQITSYGGLAPRNDHAKGQAIDIMVTGSLGDEIAQFLIDNAAELGINYIIWEQRIYTIDRPGWRAMSDRGGATANHFDHVHVSTHVDSGTGG